MTNLFDGSIFTFGCDCGKHAQEATQATMTVCNAEYKGPFEGARLVKRTGESLGEAALRLVMEDSEAGRGFLESIRATPNLMNLMECWGVELPTGLGCRGTL